MSVLDRVHGRMVHARRVRALAEHLAQLMPGGARVLDVGCGDGWLARVLGDLRPDLDIEGADVLVREETHIPVRAMDGERIDSPDGAFDVVMMIDVLHHTADPRVLLREAARVARSYVILKDHTRNGLLAGFTLRMMDWVGNARHGVALPYNYWPRSRWDQAFEELGITIDRWEDRLGLYPRPASWFFERKLHFLARLGVPEQALKPAKSKAMAEARMEEGKVVLSAES